MISEHVLNDESYTKPTHGIVFELQMRGVRTNLISTYNIPRFFYTNVQGLSPVKQVENLGALLWYGVKLGYMTRRNPKPVNIDEMITRWHNAIVLLCLAHDKEDVDRAEATLDACLTPMLTAPIKQIRQFIPRFLDVLKRDKRVPYLVWRAYEVWVEQVLNLSKDEDVKTLKSDIAKKIADLVESDAKEQLPDAIIHALRWRSPEQLQEVATVIEKEKRAGRRVRLRGRESCLFLEAGGSEDEPKVCIQL